MNQSKPMVIAGILGILLLALVALNFFQPPQTQTTQQEQAPLGLVPKNFSTLKETQTVELKDDERFAISADNVEREILGQKVFWFGYNSQSPGPLLKVKQGTSAIIEFKNNLEFPTTVHWHGLRLQNQFDGVPEITQKEIMPQETFEYRLDFPDAGLYWYHPHVREDLQQEMGLYGTILVEPKNKTFSEAQEEVLVLDDLLLGNNGLPAFFEATNFAAMGRFGNVFLVNGKTGYSLEATAGKTLRLYLVNAANARPFRFAVQGTRLKVIGGDAGFYGKPFFAESVTLGPSERAIVEVFFESEGEYMILNSTPVSTSGMGKIIALPGEVSSEQKKEFESLEQNTVFLEELEKLEPFFGSEPDFEYELLIRWPVMDRMMGHMGGSMAGMHTGPDGIEWEDSMMPINEITTSDEVTWIIRDKKTGKENMDFFRTVKKGGIKKIRITNLENSSHPMQHPIHLHGNRFLVLSEDGKPNPNPVWKDTVLVPTGKTVDLLAEFSNQGNWMIHCHIAEHLSSKMMSIIKVVE